MAAHVSLRPQLQPMHACTHRNSPRLHHQQQQLLCRPGVGTRLAGLLPGQRMLAGRVAAVTCSSRSASTSSVASSSASTSTSRNSRRPLLVQAQRRRDAWGSGQGRRGSSRGAGGGGMFRMKFNNVDVALAEDQMWRLALPLAALFGLSIFIGPLVVGLTVSAIAVGAAFSAGALAFTTLLLPLVALMSAGGLLSFGLFAGLGVALVLPKLLFTGLSMAVVGGGLLLGWGGVNWLLTQTATGGAAPGSSSSGLEDSSSEDEAEQQRQEAARAREAARIASELREFDELLGAKDRQRQRW